MHSGLAAPRDGDYVALAVHQAARVVSAAHGDQILASQFTVDLVAPRPDAIRFDSLGRFRVRDFDGSVELFQVTATGLPTTFSTPHAIPAAGHNLLRAATPFFGREPELAALVQRVAPGRIVTVLGPGGVGKTRLVTEFGLQSAPDWQGGVWLAALSPVGDPAHVGPAVAAALGARREPEGDLIQEIVRQLRAPRTVLILDNCEHLMAATSRLAATLLTEAPTAALVATSREPLGIDGEHVIRIAPLNVDGAGLEGRSLSPAMELFAIARPPRSTRSRSTTPPSATSPRSVAISTVSPSRSSWRLHASPSCHRPQSEAASNAAWQYCAARSAMRPHVTSRSTGCSRGATTSSATPNKLYSAGSACSQAASGSTRRPRRRAIAPTTPLQLPIKCGPLMDKSLVVADVAADETRYRMLTIVRRFARARLDDCSETTGVARRVADSYVDRLGPERDVEHYWLGEMTIEIDNLRALIALLAPTDAEHAQLLACSILQYHDITQSLHEGIAEAISFERDLVAETPARIGLLACVAKLYGRSRDVDACEAAITEADGLRETLAEPPWAAGMLANTAGLALLHRGGSDAALALADRELASPSSDLAQARMLNLKAIAASVGGRFDLAEDALIAGLEVERRLGSGREIATTYANLAETALRRGDTRAAAAHQLACLDLAPQIGNTLFVALSLMTAGRMVAGDDDVTAVALHTRGDMLFTDAGLVPIADDQAVSDAMLSASRQRLGVEAYDDAVRTGRALDLGDAIEQTRRVLRELAA